MMTKIMKTAFAVALMLAALLTAPAFGQDGRFLQDGSALRGENVRSVTYPYGSVFGLEVFQGGIRPQLDNQGRETGSLVFEIVCIPVDIGRSFTYGTPPNGDGSTAYGYVGANFFDAQSPTPGIPIYTASGPERAAACWKDRMTADSMLVPMSVARRSDVIVLFADTNDIHLTEVHYRQPLP